MEVGGARQPDMCADVVHSRAVVPALDARLAVFVLQVVPILDAKLLRRSLWASWPPERTVEWVASPALMPVTVFLKLPLFSSQVLEARHASPANWQA